VLCFQLLPSLRSKRFQDRRKLLLQRLHFRPGPARAEDHGSQRHALAGRQGRCGIGAFAATPIGGLLPPPDGTRVYIAGVSTRLVVEAAVFEFTDRGYAVSVVEDCCAAASPQAHADAVKTLALFAAIESADEVIGRL